jgi:hypothetical protein
VDTEKKDEVVENVKPEITDEYNKFKLSVDKVDQIVHYYPRCRKFGKWAEGFMLC